MNPFTDNIDEYITRLNFVNTELTKLEFEKKVLEKRIFDYLKNNDIADYGECYIKETNKMEKIPFPLFELKQGVDAEKCKITVPISWIEKFANVDSNGKAIDTAKIEVNVLSEYKDKYPDFHKISESLQIRKNKGEN